MDGCREAIVNEKEKKTKTTNTRKKGSSRKSHNRGEEQLRKKGDTKLKWTTLGAPPLPPSLVPVFFQSTRFRTGRLSIFLSLSLFLFFCSVIVDRWYAWKGQSELKLSSTCWFSSTTERERFLFFGGGEVESSTQKHVDRSDPPSSSSARLLTSSSFGTTCRRAPQKKKQTESNASELADSSHWCYRANSVFVWWFAKLLLEPRPGLIFAVNPLSVTFKVPRALQQIALWSLLARQHCFSHRTRAGPVLMRAARTIPEWISELTYKLISVTTSKYDLMATTHNVYMLISSKLI